MSANVKNILFNLETAPPPAAWDAISSRLDTEFDARERSVADRLHDWETAPPPAAWQHIALALQVNEAIAEPGPVPAAQPAKVINLPFRKLAIAAAVLGIVGFATWRFLSIEGSEPIVQQGNPTTTQPAVTDTEDRTVQPSLPVIDASIGGRPKRRIDISKRVNAVQSLPGDYGNGTLPEEQSADIQYAAMGDLHAEQTTMRRGVKAPLIKDASGNIILDKSLIVSRDNNYIIITGPNGEQTRLSAKFLPVLTDLNTPMDPAEYFEALIRGNGLWKGRFLQWRARLMQEASFTPTAVNFLDIMALKDLIEEK
ncbi:hypothetical protein [Paraflavitalea sp. CAU 1676]|uniref:hypothetical protein n=1 Tax=Paraflavitalea sp. CAU 1676 TaxID=3032598 RepID=UPI0023D9ADBA|nr:hypothetical protein [Paraflavitalea sp. CAU 1676]MDF2191718.1 hypothetical protein [Paraflavitalea sp. CAU 1676]